MSITPTQIDAFARFLDDLQRRITDALARKTASLSGATFGNAMVRTAACAATA